MPRFPTKEQLESTEQGRSGVDRIAAAPIAGVEESPGVPAKWLGQILGIIASRAVPLLARPDRSGIVKASRDVADPVALVVDERGLTVAPLENGRVPEQYIPAVAIGEPFEAASEAAMLALTAERGDVAIRSDINKTFMLRATPASTLSNWAELRTPTDAVLSVDGRTGAVSLSDLYAAANDARLHERAHNLSSAADHPDVKGAASDGQIYVYRASGASGAGFYPEAPGAASVPNATETEAGKAENATTAEVQAGTLDSPYFVSPLKHAAEIARQRGLARGHFVGDTSPLIINNINVPGGGHYESADLRGLSGIPSDAKGVILNVAASAQASARNLTADSADQAAFNAASPRMFALTAATIQQFSVPLGTGAVAGRVRLFAQTNLTVTSVSVWVNGSPRPAACTWTSWSAP